jgi:hypothetical protein
MGRALAFRSQRGHRGLLNRLLTCEVTTSSVHHSSAGTLDTDASGMEHFSVLSCFRFWGYLHTTALSLQHAAWCVALGLVVSCRNVC